MAVWEAEGQWVELVRLLARVAKETTLAVVVAHGRGPWDVFEVSSAVGVFSVLGLVFVLTD